MDMTRYRTDPAYADKHLKRVEARNKKLRAEAAEAKLDHGCTDCGYNKHAAALCLDRRDDNKVRCANCLAIRTRERSLARAKITELWTQPTVSS